MCVVCTHTSHSHKLQCDFCWVFVAFTLVCLKAALLLLSLSYASSSYMGKETAPSGDCVSNAALLSARSLA